MGSTYAMITDGAVFQIFPPVVIDGVDIPLSERLHPDLYATCVNIDGIVPQPQEHWTYDGVDFHPPQSNEPSIEQRNEMFRAVLRDQARLSMVPVLMSLQLGNATDQESAVARAWQTYYKALDNVDITQELPEWPTPPTDI